MHLRFVPIPLVARGEYPAAAYISLSVSERERRVSSIRTKETPKTRAMNDEHHPEQKPHTGYYRFNSLSGLRTTQQVYKIPGRGGHFVHYLAGYVPDLALAALVAVVTGKPLQVGPALRESRSHRGFLLGGDLLNLNKTVFFTARRSGSLCKSTGLYVPFFVGGLSFFIESEAEGLTSHRISYEEE